MTMLNVIGLFRRKDRKWHEVRWRSGARRIFMALQFATDAGARDDAPAVEKLPPQDEDGEMAAHFMWDAAKEAAIVREVQTAVSEYNRMNLCALRVTRVRHRATEGVEPLDYGTATRKLLNLL